MSTYHSIWWLPLCGGLTGLGLVLSYLTMRRRGIRAGLRGAAWSLLPLAAYLTGSVLMFWKMGVAIGDFAKGFAFSPRVWSGIAVAGLAAVLLMATGGVRRRRRVKQAEGSSAVSGSRTTATGVRPPAGATAALPSGDVAVVSGGSRTATVPATTGPQPATAKLPRRRKAAAESGGDDMQDVEEILRRRGIS
jgi:hypothetical protein